MGRFVTGDVVVVTFPFSDLSGAKRRPALVLAPAEFNNLILCQITSKSYASKLAIVLSDANFEKGSLPVKSYARPDKIFTAAPSIVVKTVGWLNSKSRNRIIAQVRKLFYES